MTTVAYDGHYGRVKQRTEADTSSVWLHYSRYGQVVRETNPGSDPNAANLITYRQVQTVDARGSLAGHAQRDRRHAGEGQHARAMCRRHNEGRAVLSERLGPVQATYQHSADTGQLTSMQYRRASDQAVLRALSYGYDHWGNVTSQTVGGVTETLVYDELHRLNQTTRPGQPTVSYAHDALGNLKKKTDFSVDQPEAYQYPTTNNRLTSVQTPSGVRTYSFDANGNLTGDNAGYQAIYDATNRPTSMTKGGVTNQLRYGADGSRAWSSGTDGEVVWFGAYEVILSRPGVAGQKTRTYLSDTVILTRGGGENSVVWMLKDRLGSADAIVDAGGNLLETRAHDAYGKPRSGSNADLSPARLQDITRTSRGFTQHEHLNSLELIHMNGRVFDYHLGRFHGVDPERSEVSVANVQFPTNSQSLNPYSYLMNNPLSGTDPTGYTCQTGTNIKNSNAGEVAGCKTMAGWEPRSQSGAPTGPGSKSNGSSDGQGVRPEKIGNAKLGGVDVREIVDHEGTGWDFSKGLLKGGVNEFVGTLQIFAAAGAASQGNLQGAIEILKIDSSIFGPGATNKEQFGMDLAPAGGVLIGGMAGAARKIFKSAGERIVSIAGHGQWNHPYPSLTLKNGQKFIAPEPGHLLSEAAGQALESGGLPGLRAAATLDSRLQQDLIIMREYNPGDRVPNYTLLHPQAPGLPPFNPRSGSVVVKDVDSRTTLSELIGDKPGCFVWAACTVYKD